MGQQCDGQMKSTFSMRMAGRGRTARQQGSAVGRGSTARQQDGVARQHGNSVRRQGSVNWASRRCTASSNATGGEIWFQYVRGNEVRQQGYTAGRGHTAREQVRMARQRHNAMRQCSEQRA